MPLTPFQRDVLRFLAANRLPESHLAGGIAINRTDASPRFSADIDLFHDTAELVIERADTDAALLVRQGFAIEWLDRLPQFQRAMISRGTQTMKLEWCHDSAFRFFPVQADPEFGFCLHPADLAANKALTLAARSEIRDFIDIVFLHETSLSLGAICWAACGKDEGFTPRSLLDYAKRNMKFRAENLAREQLAQTISLELLKEKWLRAAEQAESLFAQLPLAEVGCLYLNPDFVPLTPDPASPDFSKLIRHYGSIRGAWPAIV